MKARKAVIEHMFRTYHETQVAGFDPPPSKLIEEAIARFERRALAKARRDLRLKYPTAKIDGFQDYAQKRLRIMFPRRKRGRTPQANRPLLKKLVDLADDWAVKIRTAIDDELSHVRRNERRRKHHALATEALRLFVGGLLQMVEPGRPVTLTDAIAKLHPKLINHRWTSRGFAVELVAVITGWSRSIVLKASRIKDMNSN
ncbi:MAG TPA: hypothetical protein VJQ57_10035 [Acidimicrobiia bacterium]|nr:hypothetical protein [Acidimicrobiia bacterium]